MDVQMLSPEYINYAEHEYPSNHTFKIHKTHLVPKRELYKRYRLIQRLYPKPLTSLLDTSCSKGFFVFDALQKISCIRTMGIDINEYDIRFCQTVKSHLKAQHAQFALLRLHELAERVNEFGGPFQTLLLINSYQYFYFGSAVSSFSYQSHEEIWDYLRMLCCGRIIFNNRINVRDCQNTDKVIEVPEKAALYTESHLLQAASRHFSIERHGKIGKYPLFTMDVKE